MTSGLSVEENFWLRNLRNDIKRKEEAESILKEYEKHNHSNLHKSVMDLIVRANEQRFEEARGSMCDALVELMADVIEEKAEELAAVKAEELAAVKAEELAAVKVEKLAAEQVEKRWEELILKKLAKGKTVEQIADDLEESVENIQRMLESMEK